MLVAAERDEACSFPESAERGWRAYLDDFKLNVWPMMQEKGFTEFQWAFIAWQQNETQNRIQELLDQLEDKSFG